jgi:hypothetical protein
MFLQRCRVATVTASDGAASSSLAEPVARKSRSQALRPVGTEICDLHHIDRASGVVDFVCSAVTSSSRAVLPITLSPGIASGLLLLSPGPFL